MTIIVDYTALDRQCRNLQRLYDAITSVAHIGDDADDLLAAITLLRAILNERPFPEGVNQPED